MTPVYMSMSSRGFLFKYSIRSWTKLPRSWRHESRHLRKAREIRQKRVGQVAAGYPEVHVEEMVGNRKWYHLLQYGRGMYCTADLRGVNKASIFFEIV